MLPFSLETNEKDPEKKKHYASLSIPLSKERRGKGKGGGKILLKNIRPSWAGEQKTGREGERRILQFLCIGRKNSTPTSSPSYGKWKELKKKERSISYPDADNQGGKKKIV